MSANNNYAGGRGRRVCRVACIQMISENLEPDKNIVRAKRLVAAAVDQGAEIVLLPELMAAGYLLTKETWDVAEPTRGGCTERFLAKVSRKYGIYCGCTFLEAAEDGHFYNTFLLYGEGRELGRIRKFRPASFEAFIFSWYPQQIPEGDQIDEIGVVERAKKRTKKLKSSIWSLTSSEANNLRASTALSPQKPTSWKPEPHFIDTPLGRIGVSICYESFVTSVIQSLAESNIDILLMPFSCPDAKHAGPCSSSFNASVEVFQSKLDEIPVTLAKMLRVPTMFTNKTGPWTSPIPLTMQTVSGEFPGRCKIASSGGNIVNEAYDRSECVVIGDVVLGRAGRHSFDRNEDREDESGEELPQEEPHEEGLRLSTEPDNESEEEQDKACERDSYDQIPDHMGYIFSPPWMIFCLWWVTEWLGGICYTWSSTRRRKALSLSRLNLLSARQKQK